MTPGGIHSLANATVVVLCEVTFLQALGASASTESLARQFEECEIGLVGSEVVENPDFRLSFLTCTAKATPATPATLHLNESALGFRAWLVVDLLASMVNV
jgi:hypothetical protein